MGVCSLGGIGQEIVLSVQCRVYVMPCVCNALWG
jgi:hypothetical protein